MARIKQGAVEDWIEKYRIKSHWNLLTYVECEDCHDKYVREKGWQFSVSPAEFHWNLDRYICARCCPNVADAGLFIVRYCTGKTQRPEMPPVKPPAPPLRKIHPLGGVVNKREIEDWRLQHSTTTSILDDFIEGVGDVVNAVAD